MHYTFYHWVIWATYAASSGGILDTLMPALRSSLTALKVFVNCLFLKSLSSNAALYASFFA